MTAVDALPRGRTLDGFGAVVRFVRRHPAGGITALLATMLVVCVIVGLVIPDDFRFLTRANAKITLSAIPFIGISALGVGMLTRTEPSAIAIILCPGVPMSKMISPAV